MNAEGAAQTKRQRKEDKRRHEELMSVLQAQPAGDAAMREWTIAAVTSLQGQVDTLRAEVGTLRAELAGLRDRSLE